MLFPQDNEWVHIKSQTKFNQIDSLNSNRLKSQKITLILMNKKTKTYYFMIINQIQIRHIITICHKTINTLSHKIYTNKI